MIRQDHNATLDRYPIENVNKFIFLGSLITGTRFFIRKLFFLPESQFS